MPNTVLNKKKIKVKQACHRKKDKRVHKKIPNTNIDTGITEVHYKCCRGKKSLLHTEKVRDKGGI